MLARFKPALYYAGMNVIISGYGTMGHEVEKVLERRGHSVVAKVDPIVSDADSKELNQRMLTSADTAIEFSLASAVYENARLYSGNGVKSVIGTTGWAADLEKVSTLFKSEGACIHGSNFSVGANIFFHLVEEAASVIADLRDYDIMLYEIHHRNKKDSPSGTALAAAGRILNAHSGKSKIVTEKLDRKPEHDELHVASVRGGSVPGVHTVCIDSDADTIEIRHSARNRGGFALGAVLAAEWIQDKSGFFGIDEFIDGMLGKGETV